MSSANPKVHEPSMEEILASIRRIISDDQEGLRGSLSPVGSDRDETTSANTDDADEPPAFLTGDDADSPGSHPANDSVPDQPASGRLVPDPMDHRSPSPGSQPAPSASEVRPAARGRATSPSQVRDPAPEPARTADTLLSDAVSASLLNAFGRLEPDVQIGAARTLEDLVQDMLRPMLRAWLDENLSPLVERLIQAEIQRITRGRR